MLSHPAQWLYWLMTNRQFEMWLSSESTAQLSSWGKVSEANLWLLSRLRLNLLWNLPFLFHSFLVITEKSATCNKPLWTTVAIAFSTILRNMFVYSTHIFCVHISWSYTLQVCKGFSKYMEILTQSGPSPKPPGDLLGILPQLLKSSCNLPERLNHPRATPKSSRNTPGTPGIFLEPFA